MINLPMIPTPASLPGPIDGVRVLDFTNMAAGPYCTRLLADMGADVFKVEPPAGDHNRGRIPLRDGHSSFFGHLNCGKRSVLLDLKSDAGREAAQALARKVDVVIENWRPGVAARLGVGYSQLSELKPDLVYCSISGYGQTGPAASRPAYAPIIHAVCGYDLAQVAYRGQGGAPHPTATFIADMYAGLSAFGAVQAALFQHARTGQGQYIDVSMLDGMLNLLVCEMQEAQFPAQKFRIYIPIKASDGYIMVTPTSQSNFEALAHLVEHPQWITDPRFKVIKDRENNWNVLMGLIEIWTSTRTGEFCETAFLGAGVPCTRYRSTSEAMEDEHLRVRGSLAKISDPAGSFLVPNPPFQMRGRNVSARNRVAGFGEDTQNVLSEILGYSKAQIEACGIGA